MGDNLDFEEMNADIYDTTCFHYFQTPPPQDNGVQDKECSENIYEDEVMKKRKNLSSEPHPTPSQSRYDLPKSSCARRTKAVAK